MNHSEPSTALSLRRGRRRPGVSRGDLREIALLDAAEEILKHKSASEVTIDGIASATGLSRSSVYFYFDNKNAIVDAVIERATGKLLQGIEDKPAPGRETAGFAVSRLIDVVFDVWRGDGHVFRVAVEQSYRDTAGRAALQSLMDRLISLFAAAVAEDRARGVAVGGPPHSDHARATALSWMSERNCYLLFSREHTVAEEEELFGTLRFLIHRGLGYPEE